MESRRKPRPLGIGYLTCDNEAKYLRRIQKGNGIVTVEASQVVEEYAETIYDISMEGDTVIGARLAERFHVAPPPSPRRSSA